MKGLAGAFFSRIGPSGFRSLPSGLAVCPLEIELPIVVDIDEGGRTGDEVVVGGLGSIVEFEGRSRFGSDDCGASSCSMRLFLGLKVSAGFAVGSIGGEAVAAVRYSRTILGGGAATVPGGVVTLTGLVLPVETMPVCFVGK